MDKSIITIILGISTTATSIFSGIMAWKKWGVKAEKDTQAAKDEVQNVNLKAHKEVVNLKFKQQETATDLKIKAQGEKTERNEADIQKLFTLVTSVTTNVVEMIRINKEEKKRHQTDTEATRKRHKEVIELSREENSLLKEEIGILKGGKKDQAKAFEAALSSITEATALVNSGQVQTDVEKYIDNSFGSDISHLKRDMSTIMQRSEEMIGNPSSHSNLEE